MARLGYAVAAIVVALDQLTKWLILTQVFALPSPVGENSWHPPIEVTRFFNLVMVWNRGVSFGLFSHDDDAVRWILIGVALTITAVLVIWLRRNDRPFLAVVLGLIIGGAIGNVIDRLRFGAVADFFDVHLFGYHWPAFNIADSAISIGVVFMIVDGLFGRPGGKAALQRGVDRD